MRSGEYPDAVPDLPSPGNRPAARTARGAKLKRRVAEIFRHLLPDAAEFGVDLARPLQRGLDVRQDILAAQMFEEIGLLKQRRRLIPRAAQQQRPAGFAQAGRRTFRARAGRSRRAPSYCATARSPPEETRSSRQWLPPASPWFRTGTVRECAGSRRNQGTCLSCRMCGRPSRMYSSVTAATVVVCEMR